MSINNREMILGHENFEKKKQFDFCEYFIKEIKGNVTLKVSSIIISK